MLIPHTRSQNFAKKLSKELVLSDIIPLYRRLSTDDQDSVRLLTVQDLIAIAEVLDNDETKNYLLPSIRSAVVDKSWRVRYMVADHFVKVSAELSACTSAQLTFFPTLRHSSHQQ
jgi:serine/threonine-protein phosphatase 2A regulatory subunit A